MEKVEKVRGQCAPGGLGMVWAAGWLFVLGFLHLAFWKAVLAIVLWPYYLGVAVAQSPH